MAAHFQKYESLSKGGQKMCKMARSFIIFVITVGLGVLLVHDKAWTAEKKIRASMYADPVSLDPARFKAVYDRTIANNVFQGLVTFDITANPPFPIVPVLAKNFEISKDAKIITFKLHEGVKFHHGYGDFTSEDVVFTFERHRDPKVASWVKKQFEDVERIEAPDKYTVKIYLKIPSAYTLLGSLAWQNAGFIMSKKAVTKLGDKVKDMPIGTGPFYYDRWIPGEKVILKRFDDYWRTPAKVDVIEFWAIPEEIVALGALEKGDLDIVAVSQLGSYRRAKTIKGINLAQAKASAWLYILYVNNKKKPLDDIRVRRALAHALNVKGICKRIGPIIRPFPSPLPSGVLGATDEFWRYEYNTEKAKQLLVEAGYPNGFDLKMVYKKAGLYEPIALEVQNAWRDIGINVKLEMIEKGVFFQTVRKMNQHIAVWAKARFMPHLFATIYETGSAQNYSNYSNPRVDEVIRKARTATTQDEARKYWGEFQRLVTEDVANLWPGVDKAFIAISNRLKGVKLSPFTGVYDFEKAYIE